MKIIQAKGLVYRVVQKKITPAEGSRVYVQASRIHL